MALVRLAWVTDALADPVGQSVKPWIQRLKTMCRDLQQQSLSPTQWQDAIEALFADGPLHEVVRAIDFERLVEGMQYPDDRAATRRVTFPDVMFPHVASADVALDEDTARREKLRWVDGSIRARVMQPEDCLRKYGKT